MDIYYDYDMGMILIEGGDSMGNRYESARYCSYLERICRLRHLSGKIKDFITDNFLTIQSMDDLRDLCSLISNYLIDRYGYNEYFIP